MTYTNLTAQRIALKPSLLYCLTIYTQNQTEKKIAAPKKAKISEIR